MSSSLTIIGGTYLESCEDPRYEELWGSGLRASVALAHQNITELNFISCVGEDQLANARSICDIYEFTSAFTILRDTVNFHYYHPLAKPDFFGQVLNETITTLPNVTAENILYYGFIEAEINVDGNYVVYDPQNHRSLNRVNSKAKHLALVLNKNEAILLSGSDGSSNLSDLGKSLLDSQNAEIVVIKNGPAGALVISKDSLVSIPVFKTNTVWPIGSGDIFSAVFAKHWAVDRLSAAEAGMAASKATAHYCNSQELPLPQFPEEFEAHLYKTPNKVYLAGPFFSISNRWLVNELRNALNDMGTFVFSPYHDAGMLEFNVESEVKRIAKLDLEAIQNCNVVLAVLDGIDAGTLFEIGYAKSLNKRVVILSENVPQNDLFMLVGTDCEIKKDISSAIYAAAW